MSITVSNAQKQQFATNFISLYQQRASRLTDRVRRDPDSLQGAVAYFDRIGATEMVRRTTRHADTPLVNTQHSRRRLILEQWEWADLIDKQDRVRLIADPESSYMQNAFSAAGRQRDRLIISAASGNAESISDGPTLTATNVALPAGQKIAVGGTGLTLSKLLQAKEILDGNEAGDDGEAMDGTGMRTLALTAKQVTNLLNTTEIKSSDYNSVKALAAGQIDTFLGFKFVRTQLLATDASSSRLVLAFQKNAIGYTSGDDVQTDVGPRRDKSMAIQTYVSLDQGATRIQDEGVVEIACSEA